MSKEEKKVKGVETEGVLKWRTMNLYHSFRQKPFPLSPFESASRADGRPLTTQRHIIPRLAFVSSTAISFAFCKPSGSTPNSLQTTCTGSVLDFSQADRAMSTLITQIYICIYICVCVCVCV